jgi:hypothetical protein
VQLISEIEEKFQTKQTQGKYIARRLKTCYKNPRKSLNRFWKSQPTVNWFLKNRFAQNQRSYQQVSLKPVRDNPLMQTQFVGNWF